MFSLIRIQDITQVEAAEILGVSVKTIQRRLNRSLLLLTKSLEKLTLVQRAKKKVRTLSPKHLNND